MNRGIKVTLSPFPQPISVTISKVEQIAKIELSITNPTPFSSPDKSYLHNQIEPSTIWTIQHNLNKFPTVVIVDEEGQTIMGALKFLNSNTIEAIFTEAIAGQAFAN